MKEVNIEKVRDGVQAIVEYLDEAYATAERKDIKVAVNIADIVLDYLNGVLYNMYQIRKEKGYHK